MCMYVRMWGEKAPAEAAMHQEPIDRVVLPGEALQKFCISTERYFIFFLCQTLITALTRRVISGSNFRSSCPGFSASHCFGDCFPCTWLVDLTVVQHPVGFGKSPQPSNLALSAGWEAQKYFHSVTTLTLAFVPTEHKCSCLSVLGVTALHDSYVKRILMEDFCFYCWSIADIQYYIRFGCAE